MYFADQINWLIKKWKCLTKCCEDNTAAIETLNTDVTTIDTLVKLANVRAYFGDAAGLTNWTAENLGYALFWFDGPNGNLWYYDYGSSDWSNLTP